MQQFRSEFQSLISDERISNVLLAASPWQYSLEELCYRDLLSAAGNPAGSIVVTFSQTPDQWISEAKRSSDELPAHIELLCVGEHVRSAASEIEDGVGLPVPDRESRIRVTTATSPGNLTELGVRITESIEALEEQDELTGMTFCLDSLTDLLPNASMKTTMKFLQVLTTQLDRNDIFGHFHLNPEAHTEQDLAKLETLFDAVIELPENGEPVAKTG